MPPISRTPTRMALRISSNSPRSRQLVTLLIALWGAKNRVLGLLVVVHGGAYRLWVGVKGCPVHMYRAITALLRQD